MMTCIDLNEDRGKGFGAWRLTDDHALLTTGAEAFGDRAHSPKGTLVLRREPGAVDLARRVTVVVTQAM